MTYQELILNDPSIPFMTFEEALSAGINTCGPPAVGSPVLFRFGVEAELFVVHSVSKTGAKIVIRGEGYHIACYRAAADGNYYGQSRRWGRERCITAS